MHSLIYCVRINQHFTEDDQIIQDVVSEFMAAKHGGKTDVWKSDCWHTLGVM